MENKLLILAAGEGRRNAAFTFDGVLPKCLMSVGQETVVEAIINSYSAIDIAEIVIVCQSRHMYMIKAILDYKKIDIAISYRTLDELIGTYRSVVTSLALDTDYNWFINWSDVYAPITYLPQKSTIFIDKHIQHRNYAYHSTDKIVSIVSTYKSDGNIPGIFYLLGTDLSVLLNCGQTLTLDFDKALIQGQPEIKLDLTILDDVIDLGDYDKYTKLRAKSNTSSHACRYFNNIDIEKDCVKKSPRTFEGIKLHEIELAYYRKFAHGTSFAKLLSYDRPTKTMTLEKISGKTCQVSFEQACKTITTVNGKTAKAIELFEKFKEAIDTIHNLPVDDTDIKLIEQAIFNEFFEAIEKRVMPVMPLIAPVILTHKVTSINGKPITPDYTELTSKIYDWFSKYKLLFHYGITHGDPNTDNCIIDSNGDIRLIDPRGFFGNGKLPLGHGIKEYDYAKFWYGLSGYSRFNSADFVAVGIKDGNITTAYDIEEEFGIEKQTVETDEIIQMLVGIIWLKLTSYIINDPVKSVLAYLHGNALVTKILSNYK